MIRTLVFAPNLQRFHFFKLQQKLKGLDVSEYRYAYKIAHILNVRPSQYDLVFLTGWGYNFEGDYREALNLLQSYGFSEIGKYGYSGIMTREI